MRIVQSRLIGLSLLLLASFTAPPSHAQAREESKLLVATEVLAELRGQRDDVIPDRLLQGAYGIAVIPDVTKIAFVVGGRRGNGVLVVRDANGRFTNPVFVSLTGGGVGWQIGWQSTDIVLVFTTRRGVEGLAGGQLTLGAGPPRRSRCGPQCRSVVLFTQSRAVCRCFAGRHGTGHRERFQRALLWPQRRAGFRDLEWRSA